MGSVSGGTACDYVTGSGLSISFNPSFTIPRTNPANPGNGATILLLLAFVLNGAGDSFTTDSITDDATPSSCLTDDGTNKYTPQFWAGNNPAGIWLCPGAGFIVNTLTSSQTVTMNFLSNGGTGGPADFILLVARYFTGCNIPGTGPFANADFLHTAGATVPVGGSDYAPPTHPVFSTQWELDTGGSPSFSSPSGAGPSGWEWIAGELAIYIASKDSSPTTAAGTFSWDNSNIDEIVFNLVDIATGVGGTYLNFSWAEQPVSSNPDVGELVTGSWSGGSVFTKGQGVILQGGDGPTCTAPVTGSPCFNNRIRLIA